MNNNPEEFIKDLRDTRVLLFYPDITKKLCSLILNFDVRQTEKIKDLFSDLINFMSVEPKNQLCLVLQTSTTSLLTILDAI